MAFFQAEDGIRDVERSRGLGDVYKRQRSNPPSKLLNIPYQFCEWRPKLCYSTAAYLVNGGHIDAIISKMRVALLTGKEARADWVIYGSVTTYVLTRPLIDEDPFHFASEIPSENEVRARVRGPERARSGAHARVGPTAGLRALWTACCRSTTGTCTSL